jgi:hypothetical protein
MTGGASSAGAAVAAGGAGGGGVTSLAATTAAGGGASTAGGGVVGAGAVLLRSMRSTCTSKLPERTVGREASCELVIRQQVISMSSLFRGSAAV